MYTFKKTKDEENQYDCTNVTIELETVDRQEVINTFIEFLAACGYNVNDLKDEWYK